MAILRRIPNRLLIRERPVEAATLRIVVNLLAIGSGYPIRMSAAALEASLTLDWSTATTSANAWRGRVLHYFAQTEEAVSEALLALSEDVTRGSKVRLRHLVGQRFQDLYDALSEGGPFAAEGAAAAVVIAAFREHEQLRTVLCHGTGRIAVDRQGRWVLLVRVLAFRGRRADRSLHTFEQDRAEAVAGDLRQALQRVCSALQVLLRSMPEGGCENGKARSHVAAVRPAA